MNVKMSDLELKSSLMLTWLGHPGGLTAMISNDRPAITCCSLNVMCLCPLDTFKILFPEHWCGFLCVCPASNFWKLFKSLCSCFPPKLREYLSTSNTVSYLFSLFLSSETPVTHILDHLILSYIGWCCDH